MNLEIIQQDKELVKVLTSIHKLLTVLFKDDVNHNKFEYEERELSIGTNHLAVNEHIAQNRLKKINAMKLLSENWDSFKIYYKDDIILNKIGEEFIKGKFKFNDKILKEIKSYPFRKQVLNYFKKNVELKMPDVSGADYEIFKSQILPELESNAIEHIERKESLIKAIKIIRSDKSQNNLNKMWVLHDETPLGKVDGDFGSFLMKVTEHVNAGDFHYEKYETQITIEVPISGTIENSGVKEKINSSIFAVDLKNPLEYSMQVGTLQKPKMEVSDRIKSIRQNAFKKPYDPKFKIV